MLRLRGMLRMCAARRGEKCNRVLRETRLLALNILTLVKERP